MLRAGWLPVLTEWALLISNTFKESKIIVNHNSTLTIIQSYIVLHVSALQDHHKVLVFKKYGRRNHFCPLKIQL
jgi:hypothetical protein